MSAEAPPVRRAPSNIEAMMEEQRKLERFDLRAPAEIETTAPNPTKSEVVNLWTRDISSCGAFFMTPNPLPVGWKVRIDLVLPLGGIEKSRHRQTHVRVNGTVIRSESSGMAIRFDNGYEMVSLPLLHTPISVPTMSVS